METGKHNLSTIKEMEMIAKDLSTKKILVHVVPWESFTNSYGNKLFSSILYKLFSEQKKKGKLFILFS